MKRVLRGQVIDVSGNGNNGTINGATYSEDVPEQNCSNSCDEIEIDGFTYGGYFNGSNYYLSSNSYTWIESNEISNSLNGHLVTINSQEENEFISNINYNNTVWIGLYQNTESTLFSEPDGGWEWVTGEDFNFSSWGTGNYLSPVDQGPAGPENHAEIGLSSSPWYGSWNDSDGTYHLQPFILEISCQDNCSSSDEINVTFDICGCTDESACNYNLKLQKMMEVVNT